jgi:hypothetical protein
VHDFRASNDKNDRCLMTSRVVYRVLPAGSMWQVRRGKSKKSSSRHATKAKAISRASDLAKNQPRAQVIVHNADGKIVSDRLYEYSAYRKKRRKRRVATQIRKGMTRYKRLLSKMRTIRRKAAKLGHGRIKRRYYRRRAAALKGKRFRWFFS